MMWNLFKYSTTQTQRRCCLRSINDMKLIDILIEKDIQWPDGATGAVQDGDGDVKFYAGGKPRLNNGVWIRDKGVEDRKSVV